MNRNFWIRSSLGLMALLWKQKQPKIIDIRTDTHFLYSLNKRHYNRNQEIFHTVKAPATCHLTISTTFAQAGFLEKLRCLK